MYKKITTLDKININELVKIYSFDNNFMLKKRLNELGLIEGSEISLELISPFNNPKAYDINGSLFAIRNEDARHIKVIKNE